MAVYRFKVSFEDYEDVYREIEVKSDQKFIDLHGAILQSIMFEDKHPSSFFMSTDSWKKGKEISSAPKKDKEGKDVATMDKALLSNYIADPHQKIYFIVDGESVWTFHIELIKIIVATDMKTVYPAIRKTVGEAPKQFKVILPPVIGDEDGILLDEEPSDDPEDSAVQDNYADEDAEGLESEEGEETDEEMDDVEMGGDESTEEEL